MYKILLVDDEPAVLEKEKTVIRNCGLEFEVVAEAYSVAQAIGLFDQLKPDLVISDIRMPVQSGVELIKYIYEQKDCNTVCVVVSGYSEFEYVHDSFVYGAMDYMLKPIEAGRLTEILRKAKTLLETVRKDNPAVSVISGSTKLYNDICRYVETNLTGDISALQICSFFGISQSQLSRLFKKKSDLSYNEFLTDMRIRKAKELLENNEDVFVGEVAALVGFQDQYYFSKVFKKITGETPRDYRNRKGKAKHGT